VCLLHGVDALTSRVRVWLILLLLGLSVPLEAQRIRIFRFKRPAAGGGTGCSGPCFVALTFSTAEVGNFDFTQFQAGGSPCNSTMTRIFKSGGGFDGMDNSGGTISSTLISNGGGQNASGGTQDQGCDVVITAANLDSNGRGYRHYRGGTVDNNMGGAMSINLPSSLTEIWVSYLFRYASGYGPTPSYTKDLYWHDGGAFVVMGYQGGAFGFFANGGAVGGTASWASIYGGANADGSIHCYDFYGNIATTTVKVWIDGTLSFSSTSQSYGSFAHFSDFEYGENQANVSTVTGLPPSYTDFDHLQIDNNATPGSRLGCS
jgi:hypothetical protein